MCFFVTESPINYFNKEHFFIGFSKNTESHGGQKLQKRNLSLLLSDLLIWMNKKV